MDKMKQEVKDKMKYWERLCALFAILMSTNIWNYARTMNGGDAFADFFKGFQLGIAMALAREPKLLILDEPTNGLDPAGIEEMRGLIKTLPSKYGMTVMISSHILSEIDQMATIIGIINQGSLIFQERMSVLDEQRKPQIILKTSDDDTAYRFLAKLNPQRTLNGLQLGALTDEQTGAVVRELCSNNLSVYRVEEHRESLEDIFLTLTGKELTL